MKRVFFIFVIISCAANSLLAQSGLHLNLNVGNTLFIEQETKQELTQTYNGVDQEMMTSYNILYKIMVTAKKDTSYKVKAYLNTIKFHSISAYLSLGYNSNLIHESPSLMEQLYKNITVKPFYFTVSQTGVITDIIGFETIIQQMVDSTNIHETEKQQITKQFKQIVGDKAIKSYLQGIFSIFPNDMKDDLTNWNKTGSFISPPHFPVNIMYSITENKNNIITLKTNASIEYIHLNQGGQSPYESLNGNLIGSIHINKDKGFLEKSESNTLLKGIARNPSNNEPIQVEILTITKYTLKN